MKGLLKKLLRNTLIAVVVVGWATFGGLLILFVLHLIIEVGVWYFAIPVGVISAGLWYTGVEFASEKWGK